MRIVCAGSGSTGNCFYVEGIKGSGIYLDAGVHPNTLSKMGLPLANKAFCVSHEHGDHGYYTQILQRNYGAEIYCSDGTAHALSLKDYLKPRALYAKTFNKAYGPAVYSFPLFHNAYEPTGFYVEIDGESLIYLPDTGVAPRIPERLIWPDVMILEANYTADKIEHELELDPSRLYVAGRVTSEAGHLSVNQTADFAEDVGLAGCDLIILFHTSSSHFDKDEYYADRTISGKFKDLAKFAKSGMEWNTVPF